MKTPYRTIALQSGQALAIDRDRSASLYIAKGEVLLQAPAAWLADTVVIVPPRRVVAPAELACTEIASVRAIGAATVHLKEAVSLIELIRSAWSEVRSTLLHFRWLSRQ